MKKRTKLLSLILCVSMLAGVLMTGCGGKEEAPVETPAATEEAEAPAEAETEPEEVSIVMGNWPLETNETVYAEYMSLKERYNELYPHITIEGDTGDSTFKTFMTKGAAGQLPGAAQLPYTEIGKVSESGYAMELTDLLNKYGYLDVMNDQIRDVLTTDEGEIYCFPYQSYKLGLAINKQVFTEAGLVEADGSVKMPKTYEEVAEFAAIIKEKTGKAGIAFPTIDNLGGWVFTPLAWSYGVDFMEDVDGKWTATMDSPALKNALQYMYDLKWNEGVLPENALLGLGDIEQLFAANELGMYIIQPVEQALAVTYNMDPNDIVWAPLPAGTEGHYTLLGGSFFYLNADYTEAQADAIMAWLELRGLTPNVSDEMVENWKTTYSVKREKGLIVEPTVLCQMWKSEEYVQEQQKVFDELSNVDMANFEAYVKDTSAVLRAEEPVCAQELYSMLDSALQEIFTNKDVDIDKLVTQLNNNFQTDYLDAQEAN